MQITHIDDAVYDGNPLPHRAGKVEFRYLLDGEPMSPDNFAMVLSRESASFFSPRHRHPWDQIRYCVEGSIPIAPRLSIDAGEVGYFPEGVHYGPQDGDSDRMVMVLQFGGASGQGYLSRKQVKAGAADLGAEGKFDGGVFRRADTDSGRRNQDGYEAIWQHVMGRPVVYPEPRFKGPVVMQPQNFAWAPLDGSPGVHHKPLGSFSERGAALEFREIDAGVTHELGASADRRLIFVTKGEGNQYRRHTAIRLDPGETMTLEATAATEILLITLPLVDARALAKTA